MLGRPAHAAGLELLGLLAALGCNQQPRDPMTRPAAPASASARSQVSLAPRPASSFAPLGDGFVQLYPRLPDSGEWRCAERQRVVWCAGGEPAAGVVPGPADASFACGKRWGTKSGGERVCVQRRPDYPTERAGYQCRYVQERGIERHCAAAATEPARELAKAAVPACWLDRDCPAGRCDRGICSCQSDSECEVGRCSSGSCVEVKR